MKPPAGNTSSEHAAETSGPVESFVVRRLTPELFPSAGRLLADAFFTNPSHVYLCPDARKRRAQLEWLLGGNLAIQPDLGTSFCLVDGGDVVAMGFWTRSDARKISRFRMIRGGLWRAPFRLGRSGLRRVFEVTGAVDRELHRALGRRPFWYLNNMVVAEKLRGNGIGGGLLRDQLAVVARAEPAFEVALSTQRPENVTFYRRLGFHVFGDTTIGSGDHAFRSWTMVNGLAAGSPV